MTDISSSSPSLPAIGHQYHSSLVLQYQSQTMTDISSSSPSLPAIGNHQYHSSLVLQYQKYSNGTVHYSASITVLVYHSTSTKVPVPQYHYLCTIPHISTIAPVPQYQSNISNSSNAVSCFLSIKTVPDAQYQNSISTTKRFIYSGITTVPVSQSSYLSAVTPMPVPQQYNSNTCNTMLWMPVPRCKHYRYNITDLLHNRLQLHLVMWIQICIMGDILDPDPHGRCGSNPDPERKSHRNLF